MSRHCRAEQRLNAEVTTLFNGTKSTRPRLLPLLTDHRNHHPPFFPLPHLEFISIKFVFLILFDAHFFLEISICCFRMIGDRSRKHIWPMLNVVAQYRHSLF